MDEPATDRAYWTTKADDIEARQRELRRKLRADVAEARSALGLSELPHLGTATLSTLRKRWAECLAAARAAGLVE